MTKTTRRRTKIEVETHEVTVIHTRGRHDRHYCQSCLTTVLALSPERTADILRIGLNEVFARLGRGEIHLTIMESGPAFICGRSLHGTNTRAEVSNFLIEKSKE